ncbi:MAG: hypothetical protein H6825_14050 [Planctomycetes bacterium]|nr:hypothetical protein [Planctomycetota bacterium]
MSIVALLLVVSSLVPSAPPPARAPRVAAGPRPLVAVPAPRLVAAVAPTRLGPALLCFPIDPGGRDTLPAPGQPLAADDVVPAALALLASSDSGLLHMETLRRAVLRLQGGDGLARLVKRLEDEASARERGVSALRAAGLVPGADLLAQAARARFDLAYGRASAAEAGLRDADLASVGADLALVRAALPKDAELAFGAALVAWSRRDTTAAALHLQDALAAARGDALLARNLCATFGVMLDRRDLDGLDAWARSHRDEV